MAQSEPIDGTGSRLVKKPPRGTGWSCLFQWQHSLSSSPCGHTLLWSSKMCWWKVL